MYRLLYRLGVNCPAGVLAALMSLISIGCDSPFSEDANNGREKVDTIFVVGKDTLYDSLDAEYGRNKLNSYQFIQGNLFNTGNVMDLAIEGNGMFVLKQDTRNVFFRRPANFIFDAEGNMNLGNSKVRLQGLKLVSPQDPYGSTFPHSSVSAAFDLTHLTDVRLPFNDTAPPKATTEVRLARNLDSDAMGKGSILYSQKFLHHAEDGDLLIGLMDHAGNVLGIQTGDVLTFSATADSGITASSAFEVAPGMTLEGANGLLAAMTDFLRNSGVHAGQATSVEMVTPADSYSLRGAICVYNNTSAAILNFQVTSNRPISGPKITRAFAVQSIIPAGTTRLTVTTDALRSPAQPSDPLSDLYDGNGNDLGLEDGDAVSFSGSLGGNPASNALPLTYAGGPAGTTMRNVLDRIRDNFKMPDRDGTIYNRKTVELNAAGSEDDIPDGSIVVRGQPETASAIRDVSIRATDNNNAKPSPTFFNTNINMTTLRDARDDMTVETSITVYDANGKEHNLTLLFAPTATPDQWTWSAKLGGEEIIRTGSWGRLSFGQDGSVAELTYDGGAPRLEFDLGNGEEIVRIELKAGGPADFTGLTQFRTESSAAIVGQNGFTAGRLRRISIGEDGVISGNYTNGQNRDLFQIPLADFPNKRGLKQVGENSFLETNESGKPLVSAAGVDAAGRIAPGAIEYLTDSDFTKVCEVHPDCKVSANP